MLKSFGKRSVALVELLGKEERFDIVEQTLIENHLLMIPQLAYPHGSMAMNIPEVEAMPRNVWLEL